MRFGNFDLCVKKCLVIVLSFLLPSGCYSTNPLPMTPEPLSSPSTPEKSISMEEVEELIFSAVECVCTELQFNTPNSQLTQDDPIVLGELAPGYPVLKMFGIHSNYSLAWEVAKKYYADENIFRAVLSFMDLEKVGDEIGYLMVSGYEWYPIRGISTIAIAELETDYLIVDVDIWGDGNFIHKYKIDTADPERIRISDIDDEAERFKSLPEATPIEGKHLSDYKNS